MVARRGTKHLSRDASTEMVQRPAETALMGLRPPSRLPAAAWGKPLGYILMVVFSLPLPPHSQWADGPSDRRQLVLPVATTIFAGRYGVIIRYGGTVDYRPTNQAIEAETYGRQDTGNGSGQGWDERAFGAQVAERPIAVAGETGASVAHSAGSLRRGVGG